jgi:CheY-like chemotaxis protein
MFYALCHVVDSFVDVEKIPRRNRPMIRSAVVASLRKTSRREIYRNDVALTLVDAANSEIADQIATNVLIIEDEPLVALDLTEIVEGLGHSVVSIARTHKEAVAAIAATRPGLILADIQLADGSSGIEAVNEILGSLSTPVIFVTAYPERFLNGEPPEPAFLIAKPFSVDGLKAVISQALFFDKRSHRRDADKAVSTA